LPLSLTIRHLGQRTFPLAVLDSKERSMRSRVLMIWCVLLVGFVGCGYVQPTAGTEVDVTGKVMGPDGAPVAGVILNFQATGGTARPAVFRLGPDGSFSGKMISGKYTFFLAPLTETDATSIAILSKLPKEWLSANLQRQVNVSGGTIDLKF
jgi:hypothetical protein